MPELCRVTIPEALVTPTNCMVLSVHTFNLSRRQKLSALSVPDTLPFECSIDLPTDDPLKVLLKLDLNLSSLGHSLIEQFDRGIQHYSEPESNDTVIFYEFDPI